MHICADEVIAFMAALPFLGILFRTYRTRIHGWIHRAKGSPKSLKPECPHDHGDTHG